MWHHTFSCLVLLILGLLLTALATAAQPARKVPRVGMLMFGSSPTAPDWQQHSPFLQELCQLGWREGQTITVESRWAEGNSARLSTLADELVRLPVDVLVAGDTLAIQAAQHATTTIPIVILSVGDPVAQGFATSLAQPEGNITGVGGLVAELSGKWLELLTEAVPAVTRVAILLHRANPATEAMLSDVTRTARV
jgi:putative ABC transport system substrate-binding protein